MSKQSFLSSFGNAYKGIVHILTTERNMQIHAFAASVAILMSILLGITKMEWLAIIIAIALVIVSEAINTAIEAVVDLCTETYHPLAGIAKDVAAGAVLLSALGALIIGIIVFLPHLLEIFL